MRPIILSHYRKIGVGRIGTALLNSSWIWRTHPRSAASSNSRVLRSAAQSKNAVTLKTSEDSQAMLIAAHRLAIDQTGPHLKLVHCLYDQRGSASRDHCDEKAVLLRKYWSVPERQIEASVVLIAKRHYQAACN